MVPISPIKKEVPVHSRFMAMESGQLPHFVRENKVVRVVRRLARWLASMFLAMPAAGVLSHPDNPAPGSSRIDTSTTRRYKAVTITTGKGTAILKVIFLTLACSLAIVAHAADDKKAEEQKEVRKMAQDTLQRLYKAEPKAQGAVQGGMQCSAIRA